MNTHKDKGVKKIGKNLRNLVMKQSSTLMLSPTKCDYYGEIYSFPKVTVKETLNFIGELQELVKHL